MKKFFVAISFLLLLMNNLYSSTYHVIYIRMENSMNMKDVEQKVSDIVKEAEDNFIVLYSNEHVVITSDNWTEKQLRDLLNAQLSTSATTAQDEISLLSNALETGLKLELGIDEYGYSIVQSQANIDELYVHCFVGREFIDNKYTTDVIEKTMLVCGLGTGKLIANTIYYPCSNTPYSDDAVRLSGKYQLNIEPIVKQ